jgi:hypothetical protein
VTGLKKKSSKTEADRQKATLLSLNQIAAPSPALPNDTGRGKRMVELLAGRGNGLLSTDELLYLTRGEPEGSSYKIP